MDWGQLVLIWNHNVEEGLEVDFTDNDLTVTCFLNIFNTECSGIKWNKIGMINRYTDKFNTQNDNGINRSLIINGKNTLLFNCCICLLEVISGSKNPFFSE